MLSFIITYRLALIVGFCFLVLPTVLTSLIVCVPKWASAVVLPRIKAAGDAINDRLPVREPKPRGFWTRHRSVWPWIPRTLRIIAMPFMLLGLAIFTVFATWVLNAVAVVTQKCPYQSDYDRYYSPNFASPKALWRAFMNQEELPRPTIPFDRGF